MSIFRSDNTELTEAIKALRTDLFDLKQEMRGLHAERDSLMEEVTLGKEVERLTKELAKLEINESKIKETHSRDERQLRHDIGLEKVRQEQELELGLREAKLTAGQDNLAADKKRFTEQLEFNNKRFEEQAKYMKEMTAQILKRLPDVNVKLWDHPKSTNVL